MRIHVYDFVVIKNQIQLVLSQKYEILNIC